MQLAAIAIICSHFRFELAERMGGPEGVANSSINRLTLQPGVGLPASRPKLASHDICRSPTGSSMPYFSFPGRQV